MNVILNNNNTYETLEAWMTISNLYFVYLIYTTRETIFSRLCYWFSFNCWIVYFHPWKKCETLCLFRYNCLQAQIHAMETLVVDEGKDSKDGDGNFEGAIMERSSDIPKVNLLITGLLWELSILLIWTFLSRSL